MKTQASVDDDFVPTGAAGLDDIICGGLQVRRIAHGVIVQQQSVRACGAEWRRVRVPDYRGKTFRAGVPCCRTWLGCRSMLQNLPQAWVISCCE